MCQYPGERVHVRKKRKKSRKLMHNSETIKDKIKHHFYLYKNSHKKARDVNINVVRPPTPRIYGTSPVSAFRNITFNQRERTRWLDTNSHRIEKDIQPEGLK